MDSEIVELVKQSYGRCIAQFGFFDSFYENFLMTDERIPGMFKNTNFDKQKDLLKEGITLVIMYAQNHERPHLVEKLHHIGKMHSRSLLNVTPDLYPLWTASLMQTIASYDKKFTPELEKHWRMVIAPAVEFLKSMYLDLTHLN